jgi:thiamine-phosphate pyrophosphorylase
MELSPAYRVIDSNLNRLAEGLRILEDIARMILDDPGLTGRLKTMRHDLIRADLGFNLELLQSRDSAQDVGARLEVAGESKQKDLALIAVANSRRVQESLRVLEEMAKLGEFASLLDSERFKQARFEIYSLEKELVSRLVRRDKAVRISGLYVIIDSGVLNGRSHLEAAEKIIRAGVKVLQLRDKTTPKKQLLPLASELQELCRQKNVLFILNDYLDVALAIRADGLHIGQEDLPVEVARRLLPPDTLLGCSVDTAEQALEAQAAGADYLAVGSIFPTTTKNNIGVVGLERLREVKAAAKIPLAAIGGINQDNARQTVQAGADALCVISAVLKAADMTLAARRIIDLIEVQNEKND